MTISFECVQPIESHARLIMEWRNDPVALQASFKTKKKQWETFYPEFLDEYLAFPNLPPLFVLQEGKRVAFLRFRPMVNPSSEKYRTCCDISIVAAILFKGLNSPGNLIFRRSSCR